MPRKAYAETLEVRATWLLQTAMHLMLAFEIPQKRYALYATEPRYSKFLHHAAEHTTSFVFGIFLRS
jgi:predicted HD phosphohydrolase